MRLELDIVDQSLRQNLSFINTLKEEEKEKIFANIIVSTLEKIYKTPMLTNKENLCYLLQIKPKYHINNDYIVVDNTIVDTRTGKLKKDKRIIHEASDREIYKRSQLYDSQNSD